MATHNIRQTLVCTDLTEFNEKSAEIAQNITNGNLPHTQTDDEGTLTIYIDHPEETI